jgi:putative SOS response-associated peptidase YedK
MCGRYTLTAKQEALARMFLLKQVSGSLADIPEERYNIAPSQSVMAVRESRDGGEREGVVFRWGLVPFWAKEVKIGYRMINARSETAAQKPAFRAAMRSRRCLIPASGFYEWQRNLPGNRKQPYCFGLRSGEPLAMAGIWERWKDPAGGVVESCAILTTDANDLMLPVHDRMPVILEEPDFDRWLDLGEDDPSNLQPLLKPHDSGSMLRKPISTLVNSLKNDGPEILAELNPETGEFLNPPALGELFEGSN